MPRIGGFQSFRTARRTIRGFEAMLWLRKGFGFAGAWTADSDGSRSGFRDDLAHHSDLMSLGVPR